MSRPWRVTATLVAVATCAGVVTNRLMLQPLLWDVEPDALGFSLSALAFLFTAGAPAGVYLLLTRRTPRSPATFQRCPDGSAFVAPDSPEFPGLVAAALMLNTANVFPFERVPGTDQIDLSSDPGLRFGLGGLTVLMAVLALAVIWLAGPWARLTADGISMRHGLRRRDIRWDDLLPGGPHPAKRWSMRLLHRGTGARSKHFDLPVVRLRVDTVFLATVIRHYAERPGHRAAIGSQDELDRLESAYAAWRTAPAPPVGVRRPVDV